MNTIPPPVEENMEEIPVENEAPVEDMPSEEMPVQEEAPVNVFSNTNTTTMFANRIENNIPVPAPVVIANAEEERILGEKADVYRDDIRFLDTMLLPIMKKYFPSEPNLNGDINILQNVLKHDAVVVIRVQKMIDEVDGSISKDEFVEKVEDYLDELYVDKDDIEDTLEITLKYLCGMKQNLDSYVEYEFFCANIPGYKEFVDEMKKYRVVTMTNRHMFYNELHGYLHKQVFENYNFASAVYDFDSKMKEYVETQKQNVKKNKNYNVNTNMNRNNNNNNNMNKNNNNNNNNNNMNKNTSNNNNSMNTNNNNNTSMNTNNNNNTMNRNNNNNNNSMNTNNNNNNNNNRTMFEDNDDIEIEIEGPIEANIPVENVNNNNNYTRKNNNRESNNYTRKV